jgi:hypothetical protein
MIPGINLLNVASTVISLINVDYYPWVSRTKDAVGNWVATYGDSFPLRSSVQPVPRNKYAFLGLDFQKKYVKIFIPYNSIDLSRDVSGDQFIYKGETFVFESNTEWFSMDGWNSAYAVKVGGTFNG